jgi:hypothetical protein
MCPYRDCRPAGVARGSVANVQPCLADGVAADREGDEAAETTLTTATAVTSMMSDDFMTTPFGWVVSSIDRAGQAAPKHR